MDAGGGPHTYVGALSPSASATVSYLWAWDAKTAGKWMPRAAQIKSRHYKYESEQLAGRSLWSCGGQDEGSELGGKLSGRGPSSAVLTVGLHFCSACRGFAEPSWPVPTPTASLARSLDEPVSDSRRLKEPPSLRRTGQMPTDLHGPSPGFSSHQGGPRRAPPASCSTYFPRPQRPDISRGATRMPFQVLVPNSIVCFGA
ncbi:hypothetical protein B0J15DRAFT_42407 [Fusarium solani]|jgi:hypothetical protein|uniref:Uncharacterized protein n=1 Tax=Fusarium solani TaxID=169388 RepID=A0A9P9H520_FUSSL|nr:uncharacterized protein B0J15DRAFT_42407 [Fusarium solani]KAH7250448.1 hypothetical protein B0J15DRAFT_42407 [Fusarium solani]